MRIHEAIFWDGKYIKKFDDAEDRTPFLPPEWLKIAIQKGPLKPNSVSRVHDTIHCFGKDGKYVAHIIQPNQWIFYDRLSGNIFPQTKEQMGDLWMRLENGTYVKKAEFVDPRDLGKH